MMHGQTKIKSRKVSKANLKLSRRSVRCTGSF